MTEEMQIEFTAKVRKLMDDRFGAEKVMQCYIDAYEEMTGESVTDEEPPCGSGVWYCNVPLCHGPQWCGTHYPLCTEKK